MLVARVGARAFDRLGEVLEPDVHVHALLPHGAFEWHGLADVTAVFARWFGGTDESELVETAAGRIGGRLTARWRVLLRGGRFGDVRHVVEQHAYADPGPTGRIGSLSLLCSGFFQVPGHA